MPRDNQPTDTQSLCPECLKRIPARYERSGAEVYLAKNCPEHGPYRALAWRGEPSFDFWSRPKMPTSPPVCATEVDRGCPFDCGLCPDHRQHTCAALLEVARNCDLGCPVCYADAGPDAGPEPSLELIESWYESVRRSAGNCNIQLSGGEPTMRDDLPTVIALGRGLGFTYIQLNTNGLRLAREPGYAEMLKSAGLSSVFLQFDGTTDQAYLKLRGRPLLAEKIKAVEACAGCGLGVVLVPTLVPGVNLDQVGDILRLALEMAPGVRGVHFQPVSYFGRHPFPPPEDDRLTLPDLLRALEEQTRGLIRIDNFAPPACENALCSFHGNFVVMPDGKLKPLTRHEPPPLNSPGEKAEEGARRAISYVSRQWSGPGPGCSCTPGAGSGGSTGLIGLDDFLDLARTRTFTVSAMAFQDAWNVDLNRVRDCCIHVVDPEGRLIPFCAYNLTDAQGRGLYRRP